jgi:hypothetical protein
MVFIFPNHKDNIESVKHILNTQTHTLRKSGTGTSTSSLTAKLLLILSIPALTATTSACSHSHSPQSLKPPPFGSRLQVPASSTAGNRHNAKDIGSIKMYHLSKFEKLCLSLEYASKFVVVGDMARDIREALDACYWIYER